MPEVTKIAISFDSDFQIHISFVFCFVFFFVERSVMVAIRMKQPDLNWSQLMRDSLGQADLGLK